MQKKESRRKQNIWLAIAVGVAIIVVVVSQFYFYESAGKVKTEVTELVSRYNKKCPLIIQGGMRLDSVSLRKDKVVQYNLTLLNVEKETADVTTISQEIKKSLLSTAKTNPSFDVFRKDDFILVYSYNDKKKAFLFKVTILSDEYK